MAKLVIDTIELPVDGVYEHVTNNRLNASKTIKSGEEMPDLSGLKDKTSFTSLKFIGNDGTEKALICNYNHIDDFSVNYYATETSYDITLTYTE